MDPNKVVVIKEWPNPSFIADIQSFCGLTSFYCWFIWGLSVFMAPLIKCLKASGFWWEAPRKKSFEAMKEALSTTPILALPDFNKLFYVDVDAWVSE